MRASPAQDRRIAPRAPSSGRVEISFANPHPMTLDAQLLETSSTGFRAAHTSKHLAPGLDVQFRRETCSGQARVIWTHILEDRSVSGFILL
jgi:hypothetical protein